MTDGNNNVDSTILKLAEQYQSTLERSRELNDERATIRENVEKLGIDPTAFQTGLRMARDMTTGERGDYTSSLTRVLGVLDGKEVDLFGADEVAKRDKRAAKRAAATEADAADDNPRGDPAKGGAGGTDGKKKAKDAKPKAVDPKVTGRRGRPPKAPAAPPVEEEEHTETGDELIERVNREKNAEREQREGAALLDGAVDKIVDNGAGLTGSRGLGSIADERPLTEAEKAALN